jgi:hypothetical protein
MTIGGKKDFKTRSENTTQNKIDKKARVAKEVTFLTLLLGVLGDLAVPFLRITLCRLRLATRTLPLRPVADSDQDLGPAPCRDYHD